MDSTDAQNVEQPAGARSLHELGRRNWGCTDDTCGVSSGIHEGLTFGKGKLDYYGYWEKPCEECARAWEAMHPDAGDCWPFSPTKKISYRDESAVAQTQKENKL